MVIESHPRISSFLYTTLLGSTVHLMRSNRQAYTYKRKHNSQEETSLKRISALFTRKRGNSTKFKIKTTSFLIIYPFNYSSSVEWLVPTKKSLKSHDISESLTRGPISAVPCRFCYSTLANFFQFLNSLRLWSNLSCWGYFSTVMFFPCLLVT